MQHLINGPRYFFHEIFGRLMMLFFISKLLHYFNSIYFVYIFYVFLIVSPFLETSELQKNMQELVWNLSALRDYSVGVFLNHFWKNSTYIAIMVIKSLWPRNEKRVLFYKETWSRILICIFFIVIGFRGCKRTEEKRKFAIHSPSLIIVMIILIIIIIIIIMIMIVNHH